MEREIRGEQEEDRKEGRRRDGIKNEEDKSQDRKERMVKMKKREDRER
jgi:hypothetical protein